MKKNRKYLVIGIIILFIGASVLPSISGINYNNMDNISEEVIQTNFYNIDDKSLILWAGYGNVTWNWNGRPEVEVYTTKSSEFTYNLSEPGTVWITIIYNVSVELLKPFNNKHGGRFTCEVWADNNNIAIADQVTIDRGNTEPGIDYYYHAVVVPVEILNNRTVSINQQIGVWSLRVKSIGPIDVTIIGKGLTDSRTDNVYFQLP